MVAPRDPRGEGAIEAHAGGGDLDCAGVYFMGVFPAESEAVDDAGGEVVDEDIALGEKGVH